MVSSTRVAAVIVLLVCGLAAPSVIAAPQQGAGDDEALVRCSFAEPVREDLAVSAELVAPHDVLTVAGYAESIRGVEGLTQRVAATRAAFPGLTCVAEEVLAEGDRVAARWNWRGIYQGEVLGVPPAGRMVALHGMSLARDAGQRVVEDYTVVDLLGPLQQVRAASLPGGTPTAATEASPEAGQPVLSDATGLAEALRARGLTVEAVDTVRQPFLGVPGTVLVLSGGALAMPAELQVYAYPDAAAAAADAAAIGPDGQPATTMVTWIAPPHFYHQGPLLAIYLGDDPAALHLLTEVLGPPFAEP